MQRLHVKSKEQCSLNTLDYVDEEFTTSILVRQPTVIMNMQLAHGEVRMYSILIWRIVWGWHRRRRSVLSLSHTHTLAFTMPILYKVVNTWYTHGSSHTCCIVLDNAANRGEKMEKRNHTRWVVIFRNRMCFWKILLRQKLGNGAWQHRLLIGLLHKLWSCFNSIGSVTDKR